jgi:hypothetical protein
MTRVRLRFCLLFNGTNPLAHKSVLLRHSEREAEQYENSNSKFLHCVCVLQCTNKNL